MRIASIAFFLFFAIDAAFAVDSTAPSFSFFKNSVPMTTYAFPYDEGTVGSLSPSNSCPGSITGGFCFTTTKLCPKNYNPYVLLTASQVGTQSLNNPSNSLQSFQLCVYRISTLASGYQVAGLLQNAQMQLSNSNGDLIVNTNADQVAIAGSVNQPLVAELNNVLWTLYCIPNNLTYPGINWGTIYTFNASCNTISY